MKTKRISKTLEIKKETIVNLDNHEQKAVIGGATVISNCPCPNLGDTNFSTDRDCSVFVCEISVLVC